MLRTTRFLSPFIVNDLTQHKEYELQKFQSE
jgi:hypothetical protein